MGMQGLYATEYIFYAPLTAAGAQDYQSNPTIAAGDFQVSTDGGAYSNLDTLPSVSPAGDVQVKITVSAAEMTGKKVTIKAVDAAGAEWEDDFWEIDTYGNASAQHPNIGVAAPTAAAIADQVWDETAADHDTASSMGELQNNIATAAAIADQVWDEQLSGHTTAGSAGAALSTATTQLLSSLASYEARRLGRQKVIYNDANDDNPLVYQLMVDGVKVTPTSATITIYKPSSTTAVVATTAMTVSGTLMTYSVDTTDTDTFDAATGYRADIVVTYNAKTYPRHIVFDVVAYLFEFNINYDQLVAMDDGLRGMQWDGGETFGQLIQATRDVVQTVIESKVIGDDELIENMILDTSRVAVAARFYMLQSIWMSKGANQEKADYYGEQYQEMMRAILSSIKYDKNLDGVEEKRDGLTKTRFRM